MILSCLFSLCFWLALSLSFPLSRSLAHTRHDVGLLRARLVVIMAWVSLGIFYILLGYLWLDSLFLCIFLGPFRSAFLYLFSSSQINQPNDQPTNEMKKKKKHTLFWLFTLFVLCSYRARWCVAYISCHFIGSCSFCNKRDMRTTQVHIAVSECFAFGFCIFLPVCFILLLLLYMSFVLFFFHI